MKHGECPTCGAPTTVSMHMEGARHRFHPGKVPSVSAAEDTGIEGECAEDHDMTGKPCPNKTTPGGDGTVGRASQGPDPLADREPGESALFHHPECAWSPGNDESCSCAGRGPVPRASDALQSGAIDHDAWRGPCDLPDCDQPATHVELRCAAHRSDKALPVEHLSWCARQHEGECSIIAAGKKRDT